MSAHACTWLALALALMACEREVTVKTSDDGFTMRPPVGGIGAGAGGVGAPAGAGAGAQAGAGWSGIGGTGEAGMAPAAGGMMSVGSGGSGGSGGSAGDGPPGGEGGGAAPGPRGLLAGIDQAQPGASSLLQGFALLSERVTSIERLAVGSDGVSLLQYDRSGNASTLHVTWAGEVVSWHDSSGAYFAYVAAALDRHFSLLHAERYPIYEGGGGAELSGMPATYKEHLAASAAGLAFFDYPTPRVDTPGLQSYGELVLLRTDGSRAVLSDRARYRAELALSATHAAYVEYESSQPGSVGQVVVLALSGGPALAVAPGTLHQDRPALDGDWVVFEEYRTNSDAVIRAFNLATGELRDISPALSFRARADVRGGRVVFEDYRDGTADLYLYDLGASAEQPLVTGAGHSGMPRLTSDGVVWIEAQGNKAALARATFGER